MSHTERIAKLTTALRERQLAVAAVVPGASLRYLTGLVFHPSERLVVGLIPASGSLCLVLPAMELERVRAELASSLGSADLMRCFPWHDSKGPAGALALAWSSACSTVTTPTPTAAVEYTSMRVMELRALEAVQPGLRTVDAGPFIASLRMVKDAHELAAMAEAVRMIETALRRLLPHIRPGVTERQLAAIWKSEILASGAEGESFPCVVASGPNSANPHHQNSDRALQPGDLVVLDGGAVHAGYASDITRTVALGEPDPTARHIYELVRTANAAGRAAARPGVSGAEIDQAARQVIDAGGYGKAFLHRTGHGLGLDCHELPNIVAGSTEPLAAGTTFTIEPGIYLPGVGGVRIEDDVVLTDAAADGAQSLTTFERELLILPVEG